MFLDELGKIPSIASWLGQLEARVLPGLALLLGLSWLTVPAMQTSALPAALHGASPWAIPIRLAAEAIARPTPALMVVVTFLVVALLTGGFIALFTLEVLRTMAGYSWENTWLARRRRARQARRFEALRTRIRQAKSDKDSYQWVVHTRRRLEWFPPGDNPRLDAPDRRPRGPRWR